MHPATSATAEIEMRTHTTQARDSALKRLRRTNRWLIAGSVALTGALSEVAASAFAGKTVKSATAVRHAGGTGTAGSSSRTNTKPLSPPAQPPRATPAPAQPSQESPQAAPSQESPQAAPSGEPQQAAPEASQQAAPSQETPQAAPSQEAPAQEAPPSREAPPAVSGGS
jgi:type IV secretory pathway VirB10-like protein